MHGVATTALGQRVALLNAHFLFLVEQAPDNFFEWQCRIGKFGAGDRGGNDFHMLPFRMVKPDMQAFAAFFALRQMLDEQPARHTAAVHMVDGNANERRYLFRLHEIVRGGIRQRIALKRHNTLIPATAFNRWLHPVERDGKIAFAEDTK